MEFRSSHVIHRIGGKIREMRKAKSLRLAQLAAQAHISTALLSKIENGRIIPTIPKLLDLIQVLGIEPQDFFAEINGTDDFSGYILIRQENFAPYVKEESAVGFEYRSILEYPLDVAVQSFQISLVTLEPGNQRPKISTNAYEFLYLISGDLKYHLGETVLNLRSGDALFFDGNLPHVPLNQQSQPATYLVMYMFLPTETSTEVEAIN
jgi:transcriptional regulator with XRE-family HTH domain